MHSFRFAFRPLVILLLLAGLSGASAQSSMSSGPATASDWESLRPEGEEFTVLMPKGHTFESSKEPYHKMEVNARFYIAKTPTGPVFAVVSLSGIKSNPAAYSEMQRVNSYVDAFKNLFPPKIRTKVGPVKLALVGPKTLQGHTGREYNMTVGELSGIVHVFATRKRFYALAYLNSKKDDPVQEEFISSFVLPEKMAAPPPPTASAGGQLPPQGQDGQPQVGGGKPGAAKTASGDDAKTGEAAATNAGAETKPEGEATTDQKTSTGQRAPIAGGVLNGKAVVLPKPEYPANARELSGTVAVQVTIDEMGNVIEAKALSGHPLLQPVSVNAALQAKFTPTSLMGEPVKVSGVIVYNFVRQ